MSSLSGKVALVTGGSRGIGAAIARRLAGDGADVALTYVSSPDAAEAVATQIRGLGRRAVVIKSDAADPQAAIDAVEKTVRDLGRLDILVNNAGVYDYAPLEDLVPAQFDRSFAVNVRGPLFSSQAAARHMSNGGRIINIGSCLGERVADPGLTIYVASKAAITGLTKGLARDLASQNITVNIVQPGPVNTDMNPADGPNGDFMRSKIAVGGYGTPDDIAATVAHLAGESGRYITGASIIVDGGVNI